ncbi:MAG: DASS family sodium-coupled anion symporter [Flavobacteriales bacterium]|nr:DASS family sodium-coupled anion symporter [Flavobacteriales bacterium]
MLSNKNIYILLGPLLFLILNLFEPPASMPNEAYSLILIVLWMGIWWITEAIPIAVTSLLPLILFPLTGIVNLSTTAASFGHKIIFLFIGGFILALAIEKWNLHKRIALFIISTIGNNISKIILGFMLATAFLSMWISNTATTVMMLPIGLSVISQLNDSPNSTEKEKKLFGKALMLSIAFSASIGGIATLIGTPPNLIFASFVQENYAIEISFLQWMKFGLPVSVILLFIAWFYLTKIAFKFENKQIDGEKKEIKNELSRLGPIKIEEKLVLIVFGVTIFCWITRSFLLNSFIPELDDTIIAISSAILLFIIPSKNKGQKLISWEDAVKLPWGILLLFGGGLAIANGFKTTGLAYWIGDQITLIEALPLFIVIFLIISIVNFLTEITSNLATTAMLLPIMAPIALSLNINPYTLMVSTTIAASCAFMLPVATAPNALVFGSRLLKIADMIKAGVWMNIISIIILSLIVYFLLPYLWDFDIFNYER